jgi:hypothetical protein
MLFAFSSKIYAQDTLSLKQRVKLLEVYNEKILKQEFETQSNKLSSSIHTELEKAKDEVTDQLRTLKIAGGVVSLILAAGVGAVLYQYFRGLRKIADKVLKERLKTHLEDNSSYILDLVTSQKVENLIRKSKNIFVVSGSDADLGQVLKLFGDMKFSKVNGRVFRYYEKPPSSDLIIFSARDGSLPDELVREFLEKGDDNESYVHYSSGRLDYDSKAGYAERLNFANTQYTLYHQIINILSFKEVINNSSKS